MENNDVQRMVTEIHVAIVGSIDGKQKGFHERINCLESFRDTFQKWMAIVIGTAITNVGVLITQLILIYLKKGQV